MVSLFLLDAPNARPKQLNHITEALQNKTAWNAYTEGLPIPFKYFL